MPNKHSASDSFHSLFRIKKKFDTRDGVNMNIVLLDKELVTKRLEELGVPECDINECIESAESWVEGVYETDGVLKRLSVDKFCEVVANATGFPYCAYLMPNDDRNPRELGYDEGVVVFMNGGNLGDCIASEAIADMVNELFYTVAWDRWCQISHGE